MENKILVTGAGGFIGHHMVRYLKDRGYWVRGVDIKKPEFSSTRADEFLVLDLREKVHANSVMVGIDQVYSLAADMGGMGFIAFNDATILYNNAMINLNVLEAARKAGVKRLLYSSSACVYPEYLQDKPDISPLKEEDVFPAQPQDAYGWEKLFTELLCSYYQKDHDLQTRIVRFHSIYGPEGTWDGGREKVPAAICRKVAIAELSGNPEVEIWGDGLQTRSFCYIDDCVEGVYRLLASDHSTPINLGQDTMITINQLANMIAEIAGVEIKKKHVSGPQGVRGRNSDNTRLKEVLDWEPQISLQEGLAQTYSWIREQVKQTYNF